MSYFCYATPNAMTRDFIKKFIKNDKLLHQSYKIGKIKQLLQT